MTAAFAQSRTSAPELSPEFALYGEPPRHFGDDYLHLEPLGTRCRSSAWRIDRHRHNALHQLIHITRGRGEACLGAEEVRFEGPSVIIVPSGTPHSFRFAPDTAGMVVTLSAMQLYKPLLLEPILHGLFTQAMLVDSTPVVERLSQRLDLLLAEVEEQAFSWGAAVTSDLVGLLILILRARGGEGSNSRPAVRQDARLVAQLREQIEARFRAHPSLEEYAAALAVSPSRLRRACLRVTGRSVTALAHDRLMSAARQALTTSEKPIYEIAYALGFDDVGYFSRFFSKQQGCSPKQYRNRYTCPSAILNDMRLAREIEAAD